MITEKQAKEFKTEILTIYRKHGLAIIHEDSQGALIITKDNEGDRAWFLDAYIDYNERD